MEHVKGFFHKPKRVVDNSAERPGVTLLPIMMIIIITIIIIGNCMISLVDEILLVFLRHG